jgi:GNAT superfamily N-acetyltransferase
MTLAEPEKLSFFLRRAERADARSLARLRVASLVEQKVLAPGETAPFERAAAAGFATLLREDRMTAWLLIVDGTARGSACALYWERLPYPGTALHAELSGVYVEPPFRGRGIARELCREAIDAAWARGSRHIKVHSSPGAVALYRALGFVDGREMRLERPTAGAR